MKYKCYLCQNEWNYEYSPQYRYIECPNCEQYIIEEEARKDKYGFDKQIEREK